MADWKTNPIMTWNGTRLSDHGRAPLQQTVERIGTDKRTVNGTLRRQFIKNKKSWSVSWENIPSTNSVSAGMKTADGGMSGEQIESFYNTTPGAFRLLLRRGSAIGLADVNPADSALPFEDSNFYVVKVMITDFTKEVSKRGIVDLWNVSVSLEEV